MSSRFIIGDTRDVLRSLPDASVDLVMSSPPFLALRSYLPADHPDKAREIGSEPTPGAFLDTLLDVVEECARVLTPHGSLVFELGDTYSGSGGAGGDYGEDGLRAGQNTFTGSAWKHRRHTGGLEHPIQYDGTRSGRAPSGGDWPLAKSLCMIPSSFAWALSYGRNPWTGRETEPWRVRNLVAWCRPNPPVGALGDKFRPGTSYLTVACKSRARWFDLDAVRTEPQGQGDCYTNGPKSKEREAAGIDGAGRYAGRIDSNPAGAPPLDWWEIPQDDYTAQQENVALRALLEELGVDLSELYQDDKFRPATSFLTVATKTKDRWFDLDAVRTEHTKVNHDSVMYTSPDRNDGNGAARYTEAHPAGAPPLDWWEIPTQPYAGSHYATFPEKLVVRPIESMCPRQVCRTCGEPRRRLTGDAEYQRDGVAIMPNRIMGERGATGGNSVAGLTRGTNEGVTRVAPTLGWSDCGHDDYRRGVTLDPFAGSGTTLAVAEGLGRDSIGIDLDARNADLAAQRVGMFLSVETFEPVELGEVS